MIEGILTIMTQTNNFFQNLSSMISVVLRLTFISNNNFNSKQCTIRTTMDTYLYWKARFFKLYIRVGHENLWHMKMKVCTAKMTKDASTNT